MRDAQISWPLRPEMGAIHTWSFILFFQIYGSLWRWKNKVYNKYPLNNMGYRKELLAYTKQCKLQGKI